MQKGISAVVGIVLLLLVTVSLAGTVYVFVQRTATSIAEKTDTKVQRQMQQFGLLFSYEGADKNRVFIRNMGTTPIELRSLSFYVNDQRIEASGPASLSSDAIGDYYLNDSRLAMLPDPAALRITGGGYSLSQSICFYCKYYAAYWKLDEGSGSAASDSAGTNSGRLLDGNAQCGNPPTTGCPTWSPGQYGNALQLDGSNDYIDAGPSLKISGPLTLSLWMKALGSSADGGLAGTGISSYQCTHHLGTNVYCYIGNGGNQIGTSAGLNSWTHMTFTWDGTTNPDSMKLYINGNLVSQAQSSAAVSSWENFLIGKASTNFNGVIDDVRVLNFARSMTTA